MRGGLQDNTGQEAKDSHWVPGEQQGAAQACQEQSVLWERGQQPPLHSSHRDLYCSLAQCHRGAPPNTRCHFMFRNPASETKQNTTSKCPATSHSSESWFLYLAYEVIRCLTPLKLQFSEKLRSLSLYLKISMNLVFL